MLRAILLTAPFVLSVVISCGDSTPVFDDAPGSAGTDSSQSGASGNTSSQAGSTGTAGSSDNKAGNGNGGSNSNGGSSNGAGTGNNAGNGNGAGTGNNAGNGGTSSGGTASTDGGTPSAGAPTDPMAGSAGTAGDTGAAGAPNGPLCPDIFGSYDVVDTAGNCDGVGKNAPQLIQGTDVACFAHFVSLVVGGGGNPAVNGGVAVDQDGNFSGVKLYFGMKERSPCMGTWNEAEERMTVKCGGPADSCTVLLDRK
jgi:hypothetical protein